MITMLLALTMAATPPPQPPDPGPGVPLSLAEARARRVSDVRYDLYFNIPENPVEPIDARAIVTFQLHDPSAPLALDFAAAPGHIVGMTDGHGAVPFRVVNEHLVIPATSLREGDNTIRIEFVAGDASLNRTPDFMYTLFVPARARLAFPCFDQPDLKARYTLSLEIPAEWVALANGAETARASAAGGRTRLRFAETEPLSTYLFAFAAGKFTIETAERNGRTFRMFHRETDAAKVARNRDAIFDLHAAAIAWLEQYTGIPYPFGKFDFLLVPSFQFGGMEHAGAIFYNASGLLLDESATQNQKLGRASVIAHETSHMWFGDLVTMRWFNDVWMKEVFANFMAAKIVNPSFPGINHALRFLYAHYPAAYDVDRTAGTNAIRQPLENLAEAGTLYGAIIYEKAPIVMRQLEMILGEDRFRDGLREYLGAHRFGNATWPDLIAVLDAATPENLETWSRAWVDEAGRPEIATGLELANGTVERLSFDQKDPVAGRGLTWTERLRVTLGYDDSARDLIVSLDGAHVDVAEAHGLPAPRFVLPTGGGIGYGGFALDAGTRAYLLAHLPDIADPLTRGAAAVTLWEDMLDGRSSAADVLEVLMAALPRERDELNLQRMLGYTQQAYLEVRARRNARGHRVAARAAPARRPRRRAHRQPEVGLVLGPARHRRDDANARVAGEGVAAVRGRTGADPRRARLYRPRPGARAAGGARVEGNPGSAGGRHEEPGSPGSVRVRASSAIPRSGGARRVLRQPRGREEPPPGALGPRGPLVPAPPAAGGLVGEVHPAQPRDAARHPADRRHLLSEAVDGCDAVGTPLARRRPDGDDVHRSAAGGLSGQAPPDHPLGRRQPPPRERTLIAFRAPLRAITPAAGAAARSHSGSRTAADLSAPKPSSSCARCGGGRRRGRRHRSEPRQGRTSACETSWVPGCEGKPGAAGAGPAVSR